jgi:O-antigen/teichoic acid export membrane protein
MIEFNFFETGTKRTINVKKNIVVALVIKGISFVISLLYVPLLLDCLDETKYGVWIALSSIIGWIGVADIGLGNGLKIN